MRRNQPKLDINGTEVRRHRQSRGLSLSELADRSGVSRNAIARIEIGRSQQMFTTTAKQLAKALSVTLESLVGQPMRLRKKPNPSYIRQGLFEDPIYGGDSIPFQDFRMTSPDNQPADYVWFDLRGNDLSAEILQLDDHSCMLKVSFRNLPNTYAGNIAIHPQDLRPRRLAADQDLIGFNVTLLQSDGHEPIGISVRLRDKNLRQWVYLNRRLNRFEPNELREGTTIPCTYTLQSLGDSDHFWEPFRKENSDRGLPQPDFSVLTGLGIECGSIQHAGRMGPGEASFLVSPIWIGNATSIEERLRTQLPTVPDRSPGGRQPRDLGKRRLKATRKS